MQMHLVPLNPRIGEGEKNLALHLEAVEKIKAHSSGASLFVFPELSLFGYPSQDLLHRPGSAEYFVKLLEQWEQKIQARFGSMGEKAPAFLVGLPWPTKLLERDPAVTNASFRSLANAAMFFHNGRREIRLKTLIPFYDVFSESRYFESALSFQQKYREPIAWQGKKIGVLICEDSWDTQKLHGMAVHGYNPSEFLQKSGAEILINLSASPFDAGKKPERRNLVAQTAKNLGLPIAYVNHFGAQDEIIFDGDAFVFSAEGKLLEQNESFSGNSVSFSAEKNPQPQDYETPRAMAELEKALVLGIRDYAVKNGFKKAVLGISGGIDSALVAVLAAKALGAENILGLSMPSKFSSTHSIEDAEALARNLGFPLKHFPIKMPHSTFAMALKPFFSGLEEDLTEENLQSRLRGVSVMAFSNKFSALALATGNKSELAVGYSTLYGDMCGGLAPLGDVYKTEVYALVKYINRQQEIIPQNTIDKAPSAELRPNQTDQDSLPPYDLLDAILFCLVEEEMEVSAVHGLLEKRFPGLMPRLVEEVAHKLKRAEFKRRQAPPVLRVSRKSFGMGRLYPIT